MFDNVFDDPEMFDETDNFNEASEVISPENNYEDIEAFMEPEIRYDIPGVESAVVSGNPEIAATIVDCVQGDEVEGALGTCGLTSIANVLRLSGMEATEGEVVTYALENGLCVYNEWNPLDTGGTTPEDIVTILDDYGVEAHSYDSDYYDNEKLAQAVEAGKGIIVTVDAGELWDDPSKSTTFLGNRFANHAITVTGAARDAETGDVVGFFVCDSGGGEACKYISAEHFNEMYGDDVINSVAIVTDDSTRVI